MKTYRLWTIWVLTFSLLLVSEWMKAVDISINRDWKFFLGDNKEAVLPEFDDRAWSVLDLPHDWAFEHGYSADGAQRENGGYACGGIGWYRKELTFTQKDLKNKNIFIDFEAVYMNSEVWINGHYLGKRPYGYISFSYDLTPYLKVGRNLLSVRVDNSKEPSARWYHGCGIYSNVYLRIKEAIYFEKDGIFITTPAADGRVEVQSEIVTTAEQCRYALKIEVLNERGKVLVRQLQKDLSQHKGLTTLQHQLSVERPECWSPDAPTLYTLRLSLLTAKGRTVDTESVRFGFKSVDWHPEKGLFLNGKSIKMRGVCDHLEGGPTGAYYTKQLLRWKIQILKDMGCNAIRTAHNPQIPDFYSLCDEMGMMVMDELFDGWLRKAPFDYGYQAFDEWWQRDLTSFVRRDRNHPSVILYSMGNETRGKIAPRLVALCHQLDPTRKVTSGHSNSQDMDILGMNGGSESSKFIQHYQPGKQAFIGTENPHTWQVRGYYRTHTWYRDGYHSSYGMWDIPSLSPEEIFTYDWVAPEKRKNRKQIFNSSYDNATVRVSARQIIEVLRDKDWFSGSFRWTGFDYLGEAGYVHGGWPFRAFEGGALDLAGFPKDLYYLYQSEWSGKDMVHILPHWTHPVMPLGTKIPVWVYTSGDEVELLFNGVSLGRKTKGKAWNEMQCEWLVPWQSGTIEAVAYRDGKEIARTVQRTSKAPSRLSIAVDNTSLKADRKDISIVTLSETDEDGTIYPYGENRVFISLTGGARVLSFENGSPVDTETNFGARSKRCFFGLNRLFIQSTDEQKRKPVSLLVGAICGDKQLTLSDSISIFVDEVSLRGKKPRRNLKIFYTLDGTIPTTDSQLYTSAFPIRLGTTVTAAVYDGHEQVLTMEERFAADEGLYWGISERQVADLGEQAEEAKLEHCKIIIGEGKGYQGRGYVIPEPTKGVISWYQENDGEDAKCKLVLRYAYLPEENCKLEVFNNGQSLGHLTITSTKSKNAIWNEKTMLFTLYRGANRIQVKSCDAKVPAIDQIRINF